VPDLTRAVISLLAPKKTLSPTLSRFILKQRDTNVCLDNRVSSLVPLKDGFMNFGESYLDLKMYRRLLPILLYFAASAALLGVRGYPAATHPPPTQALHDLPFSVGRSLHFSFAFTFL
jgi:hypothetical protein